MNHGRAVRADIAVQTAEGRLIDQAAKAKPVHPHATLAKRAGEAASGAVIKDADPDLQAVAREPRRGLTRMRSAPPVSR